MEKYEGAIKTLKEVELKIYEGSKEQSNYLIEKPNKKIYT